ncbi:MAG: hypothetical protein HRU70_12465 [Phycisphaeraceae bacterium]|nr:MAG: hypothetical protein HRU70_12465 [Phycisphaeraceae bacterium]
MSRAGRIFEGVHAVSLAVWFAALAGAGLAAGVAFPAMKSLDPGLPGFSAYDGPHWLIAGGHVGRGAFSIAEKIVLVSAAAAVVSLAAAERAAPAERWRSLARWVLILTAGSLAVWQGLVQSPRMNRALDTYWSSARAGMNDEADQARRAFEAMHPSSRGLMTLAAACVLGAIAAGGLGASGRADA